MLLPRAEAFFEYLAERERVRLRKEAGLSFPWTDDLILREYKFTNVRRQHDRTSMELRQRFYGPHFYEDRASILMNCAMFRYFGTWEFAAAIGWMPYDDFDFEWIKCLATRRLAQRKRVFTGAYVITNQGISAPKQEVVVDHFLKDLHETTPKILEVAKKTQSWEQTAQAMREIKGFGGTGFMAKEVLIDTTYTNFWEDARCDPNSGWYTYPKDWWSWTPIGPGALRGAARVKGDESATPLKEKHAREVIDELFSFQGTFWSEDHLTPTDIQFGLCEFDKYERVRLNQGRPRSRYRNS